MANLIQSAWKATLETIPTKSELSLHSLWDLLYNSDGSLKTSNVTLSNSNGISLAHDIICYSTLEYPGSDVYHDGSATVKAGTNTYDAQNLYYVFGIDVSIAQYDSRVKNKELVLENAPSFNKKDADDSLLSAFGSTKAISNSSISIFTNNTVTLHDKKSVLKPDSDKSFIMNGVYSTSLEDFQSDFLTSSSRSYYPPNVLPYTDNISDIVDIYLLKSDIAFRGTLTTTPEYSAYNKLCLNYKSKWTACLVLKALANQFAFDLKSGTGWMNPDISWLNFTSNSIHDQNISNLSKFVFSVLPTYINLESSSIVSSNVTFGYIADKDSTWAQLLKHTFVWVKAPFFGDYIEPTVFEQDLTPESDVKHRNLILSNISDYNRYDETTSADTKPDTESLPYIPVASPTVDLLTKKLAGVSVSDLSSLTEDDINTVIDAGDEDDSVIGGIAMASETRDASADIVQPGYWDPESKRKASEYAFANNLHKFHLPTIIPSTGNIFTDGRIISPTIDELWIYIKQLTSGRNSDTYTNKNVTHSRIDDLEDLDEAIPFGTSGGTTETGNKDHNNVEYKIPLDKNSSPSNLNRNNSNSTRLDIVPTTEYSFDYNGKKVYGDIVGINVGVDDDKNQTIKISNYVNSNDAIVYGIYSSLKHLSDNITTFDYTDKDDDGHKEREIYNFTAWNTVANDDTDVTKDQDIVVDKSLWKPRNAPYSLRELEALIKGNKFNLITLARFIKENFGVTGRLGKVTSSGDVLKWHTLDENNKNYVKELTVTEDNITRGSLYQFHKDYNFDVAHPNTWFNQEGEGTPDSGIGAVFDGTRFSDATDLTYGDSDSINRDQAKYSSSDVYLAADGTYRYLFDHVRLPIINVDY